MSSNSGRPADTSFFVLPYKISLFINPYWCTYKRLSCLSIELFSFYIYLSVALVYSFSWAIGVVWHGRGRI